MPGPTSSTELFLRAQTDDRLLALAAEGHGLAFSVLAGRHRAALLGHARRLVGGDGEDVLQQALLRAWSSLQRGVEVRHVAAWLHRIVHNAALDELNRRWGSLEPLQEHEPEGLAADAIVEERLQVKEMLRNLAMLPERQRLALLGTVVEGRSRRQLAVELGLTEGAVRQLVHRARSGLRAAVAAVVPYPLVLRLMRSSGWTRGQDAARSLQHSTEAVTASGMATVGVVKATTVVLAVGALGGGLLLPGSSHQPSRHSSPGLALQTASRHQGALRRDDAASIARLADLREIEASLRGGLGESDSHRSGNHGEPDRRGAEARGGSGSDGGRETSRGDSGTSGSSGSDGSSGSSDGGSGSSRDGGGSSGSTSGSSGSSDGSGGGSTSGGGGTSGGSDGGSGGSSTTGGGGSGSITSSGSDGGSTTTGATDGTVASTSGPDGGGGSSGGTATTTSSNSLTSLGSSPDGSTTSGG